MQRVKKKKNPASWHSRNAFSLCGRWNPGWLLRHPGYQARRRIWTRCLGGTVLGAIKSTHELDATNTRRLRIATACERDHTISGRAGGSWTCCRRIPRIAMIATRPRSPRWCNNTSWSSHGLQSEKCRNVSLVSLRAWNALKAAHIFTSLVSSESYRVRIHSLRRNNPTLHWAAAQPASMYVSF
jgi:hypothetical protein